MISPMLVALTACVLLLEIAGHPRRAETAALALCFLAGRHLWRDPRAHSAGVRHYADPAVGE